MNKTASAMKQDAPAARAWKLPAFAACYVCASYLAYALAETLSRADASLLWSLGWFYSFLWFGPFLWLSAPAWVLFHLGWLASARSYYRSGLPRRGWRLVMFSLLCSAAGASCMTMLSLLPEMWFFHAR